EVVEPAPGGRFDAIPGRGFWLITRDDHQVNTSIAAGLSTASSADRPIALGRGWNMIADPFDFPVAWAAVRTTAGVGSPVAFDPTLGKRGDYATTAPAQLEPFEGYFIHASADQETLWVPPVEAPTPAPLSATAAPGASGAATPVGAAGDAWQLRLH